MSEMIFIEKPPQSINDSQGRIQGGGDILLPWQIQGGAYLEILCSYFQNSFSISCLGERNPSAKQEKYLS